MVDLEGAHLDPLDRLDHEVRTPGSAQDTLLRWRRRRRPRTPAALTIASVASRRSVPGEGRGAWLPGYAQGLRGMGARPAPARPLVLWVPGGGYRCQGRSASRKALARCASTHLHDATVRRTALRGRPARRPARRDAGRITSAGQRRRRPRKAALRVAFRAPSGRRERSAMPRHRRRAPSCRGNGKRDPTCRRIVQGSTGIVPRPLFLACRPISAVPHLSLVRKPG